MNEKSDEKLTHYTDLCACLLYTSTAVDIEDKEGTNTTREGLDFLAARAAQSVKKLPMGRVITSFAGLRAHEDLSLIHI